MGSRAAGELVSWKGNSERGPSAGRQGNIRSTRKRILVEGRNCWRIAEAGRAAFLVDAAAYFGAFVSAVMKARESILILAWDIDSRVLLKRDDRDHGLPKELGNFLDAIISRRRGLHAHILAWDFHFIYAFEREPLPVVRLEWRTYPHLHFRLDGNHPFWASLHQKVVVVDDDLVRVGSSNLTNRSMRLDTECDLAVEAEGIPRLREKITEFRSRLLAEHLGTSPGKVAEAIAADGDRDGSRIIRDHLFRRAAVQCGSSSRDKKLPGSCGPGGSDRRDGGMGTSPPERPGERPGRGDFGEGQEWMSAGKRTDGAPAA